MHKSLFTLACIAWLAVIGRPSMCAGQTPRGAFPKAWISLEYLNLWTRPAPVAFPLVTTGDAAGLGRLGAPGTHVLLGDEPLGTGPFPGFRATLGGWFGDCEIVGLEISGFATGVRAAHFQAASDAVGNPLLAIPFADVTSGTPQESSLVIAQPGVRRGLISADDASIFGGIEADGLLKLGFLPPDPNRQWAAVGGLRFITLHEQFQLSSVTTDMAGVSQNRDDLVAALDSFLGAEFGLRGSRRFNRLTLELTGKAAFGSTWQAQSFYGQSNAPFAPPLGFGGFFTEPSNTSLAPLQRVYSVVPSARFRIGYDLSQHLRLTASYEGLLWTHIVRPSNELDREINLSQTTGPLVGPARPTAQSRQSDFWAQGFSVGLQVNY